SSPSHAAKPSTLDSFGSTSSSLTMVEAFSSLSTLHASLSTTHHSPLATLHYAKPAASVTRLSPVHYRRRNPRPVSYYALFKWWLLLSQHPGCLRTPTSFRTERVLGTLAGDLGCSPLDYEAYPPQSICRCYSLVFGVWFRRV